MTFGRQLIRFSLPGGLFGLLAAIYIELFRTSIRAFGTAEEAKQVGVPLDPLAQNFIATAVGLLVAGFVIYQTYYVFYRPQPRFLWWRLPVPRDRGGAILMPLVDLPGMRQWVEASLQASLPEEILPFADVAEREKAERERWYENNALVRGLLNYVAQRGGKELKSDIAYRADMYHALGACRWASFAASGCATIYVVVAYHADVARNWPESAMVFAIAVWSSWFLYRVFRSNRKNAWYALTAQARQGLLAWFTTHPESPLLRAMPVSSSPDRPTHDLGGNEEVVAPTDAAESDDEQADMH